MTELLRAGRAIVAPTTADVLDALAEAREHTLALVEPLGQEDLERAHSKLMSPWCGTSWGTSRRSRTRGWPTVTVDRPLLRDDLMDVYDALERPRSGRGSLPLLRSAQAYDYWPRFGPRPSRCSAGAACTSESLVCSGRSLGTYWRLRRCCCSQGLSPTGSAVDGS